MLVFFTDSDCDITPQMAKQYNMELISMPYIIDGKEIYPYVDWEQFDGHEFYQQLRNKVMPQTCAFSPEDYKKYFEPHFAAGNDILYVHFSAAMTGTFNAMRLAIEELQQQYPERKFYSIDTKAITILSRLIVEEAAIMYNNGATAEQIVEWANTEVDKFAVYFYADDLSFFRRSGRVSNLAATMGNLIGIHPVLHMNREGKMQTLTKAQGRRKTIKRIVSYVEEYQQDIQNHKVIVGHCDALDLAKMLADQLIERFGEGLNIEFVEVNPTTGSHCGPDTIGVAFHAKERQE